MQLCYMIPECKDNMHLESFNFPCFFRICWKSGIFASKATGYIHTITYPTKLTGNLRSESSTPKGPQCLEDVFPFGEKAYVQGQNLLLVSGSGFVIPFLTKVSIHPILLIGASPQEFKTVVNTHHGHGRRPGTPIPLNWEKHPSLHRVRKIPRVPRWMPVLRDSANKQPRQLTMRWNERPAFSPRCCGSKKNTHTHTGWRNPREKCPSWYGEFFANCDFFGHLGISNLMEDFWNFNR